MEATAQQRAVPEKMGVVAVWWAGYSGGHGEYPYSRDYPDSLAGQLRELGHELTVLSDVEGYRPLLSPSRYRGWFAKLEVFRPENRDLRPCLCIDLDTFIMREIEPVLNLDATRLWLIRNFYRRDRSESGLFIAPKNSVSDDIWRKAEALHGFDRGDGDLLKNFPHGIITDEVDGILSYKVDHLQDDPKDARIVCFHGKPKPEQTEGWAKRFWYGHTDSGR